MEDRSGGTCGCGGPTLSYTKDQILALRPPQHLPQSGRNGDDQSKASSSQVINSRQFQQKGKATPPGLQVWQLGLSSESFLFSFPNRLAWRKSFLQGNIKSLQVTFPIATSCIDHWFNLVFSCRHAESEPLKTKV